MRFCSFVTEYRFFMRYMGEEGHESPMAYKDPKEILQLITDTVEVEYFIKPVINLKATNSYDSSVELDMNEEQD